MHVLTTCSSNKFWQSVDSRVWRCIYREEGNGQCFLFLMRHNSTHPNRQNMTNHVSGIWYNIYPIEAKEQFLHWCLIIKIIFCSNNYNYNIICDKFHLYLQTHFSFQIIMRIINIIYHRTARFILDFHFEGITIL